VQSVASSVTDAYSSFQKISLQSEPNNVIVAEIKQENIEMVDIPDLPLDALEQAMAEEVKDLTIQDESGGSVVFGVIGARTSRWTLS